VAVAGLVICRQRPGTAKGVIFLTLEDETGVANIVVWAAVFERFRRAVIAGRCLKVTGRLQRDGDVVHVVAEGVEDISALLDEITALSLPERRPPPNGPDARTPR
jgi:DNA polymerase III alpha subunit